VMTYLIRLAPLLAGGTASVEAYQQTRDPILPAIILAVLVVGFIEIFFWRLHGLGGQNSSRD
jgi:hypothetical protein